MIGQLVRMYCEGRRDAQHGKRRARLREGHKTRRAYLMGWRDECERMRAARLLAQYELDLTGGADAVGPKTLPDELD